MRLGAGGFSIIECLMALVVFTVGVLAAAGTTALAVRASGEGESAAAAAGLARGTLDSLRYQVAVAGGECAAAASGAGSGPRGTTLAWTVTAAPHGLGVMLIVTFPTVRGLKADTLWSHLSCR